MDFSLDQDLVIYHFTQIGIAFALALPVAFNREQSAGGAGLRTFPLVAVAACAYMLVGMSVYQGSDAEARVMYGILTGMGFIGGGAILKHDGKVGGTATAAAIWNTGAIGVSVAYSRYEIAVVLSAINYLVFQFARPLKKISQPHASDSDDR
ncbi:MAG: MgtC/SapB family protein [Pseudomonadota bacterium]|nr:magnesium transporter MgtC [Pseudomonadales bacterium]MDY6919925.1 MgtC/SapB family protein [Pseudomonadota bacterium]